MAEKADPSFECRLNKSCSFLISAEISKNMVLVDIELVDTPHS